MTVDRDPFAQAMRLVHHRSHFIERELGSVDLVGQRHDAARGAELDDIGAVLHVEADRFAKVGRAVRDAIGVVGLPARGAEVKARIAIGMAAGRADQIDCHQHPGTRELSLGDRIAQAHIDKAVGIEASHIAHGGEAALEGDAGMDRGLIRLLCDVMPEAIDEELLIRFYSNRQMSVRVDETRA